MNIRREIVSFKWWLIIPLISLYLWNDRRLLILDAKIEGLSINFWDLTLRGVSDVYLIIYLVFPIYLFAIGHQLTSSFDYTRLIRLGSFRRWIIKQMWEFAKLNIVLLAIWNICSLLVSISLDFSWQWSEYSQFEKSGNEILFEYSQTFSFPLIAQVLQSILFFLTLTAVHLTAAILFCIFQSKRALHLFLVSLLLMSILSFKVIPPSFSYISLPNYLSLFHGIENFNSPVISFFVLLVVLGILYLALPFVGKKFTSTTNFFKLYGLMGLFISLIGLYIVVKALEYNEGQISVIDLLIISFYGTSVEAFNLLSFSFYVITFLGFVYFIQLILHEQLTQMSHASIMRFRSLLKWMVNILKPTVTKLIIFLFLLLGFTLLIAHQADFKFEFHSSIFPDRSIYITLYHFVVNGFLQVFFYILLVFAISLATLDVMKSFITILSLSFIMFPGINTHYYLPVGLNSMGLLGEAHSMFQHTFILILYISLISFFLVSYLRRKDFNL